MAEVNYSKLQALIVDDFDSFRMTVSKMLQDIGIQHVDSAVNGTEALRQCRHKAYDLILCDHNLGKEKPVSKCWRICASTKCPVATVYLF